MTRFLLLLSVVFALHVTDHAQKSTRRSLRFQKASAAATACNTTVKNVAYRTVKSRRTKSDVKCVADTQLLLKANDKDTPETDNVKRNVYIPNARQTKRPHGEKLVELSGAVYLGFNNSNSKYDALNSNGLNLPGYRTTSNDLSFGVDLHFGTFILDPRFIKIAADVSFARDKGSFDTYETRNGMRGLGFAVDFLPTSEYPFRFRYAEQKNDFLGHEGETTNADRRLFGFSWQFHKPKLPVLTVNYDNSSYNSQFLARSFFKTDGQALSVTATDTIKGWNLSSSYNYQSTAEGLTSINTKQNFFQAQAQKELSKKSDIFIGSFFETIRFTNRFTRQAQEATFFDVHTDLNYRPTNKLIARVSHRYYYNVNDLRDLPGAGSTVNQYAVSSTTSSFNSLGGQLTYRLLPGLDVGATTSSNFISTSNDAYENPSQMLDFAGTINWHKSVKSLFFHADANEGIAYVRSNFGNQRSIGFRTYYAGVTYGKAEYALVSADYNYSYRPDIFQIGGFFSENNFSVSLTTEMLRLFRVRASLGTNNVVYLTSRGRENYDRISYTAGIEHRFFTLELARNTNDGIHDVFATTVPISTDGMFIVLPTNTLIRNPFLRTEGSNTSGVLRIQPRNDLTFDLRYRDDQTIFVLSHNVNIREFNALATYRLGKFTFSGGVSRDRQITEGVATLSRNFYYFRVARTFRIF
jgi:hypothetical protein